MHGWTIMFRRHGLPALMGGVAFALASQLVAPAVARAQAPAWRVGSGEVLVMCPLTVGGSFEAKTQSVSGQLAVDPAQMSRLTGEIAVDLKTLDSGIGLRNTHMRDNYLEVGKGDGFDRAVLSEIVLQGDAATVTGATTFTATLLVHGTRKPVSGQARISRAGTDVRVDASFMVNLPDFGIPKPRYLGVGVKDQVQVKVKFGSAR
jgi:polyisoprenoid-binding protein YceI